MTKIRTEGTTYYVIRGLDTLGTFSAILYKETTFVTSYLLFCNQVPSEKERLEAICFLLEGVYTVSKRGKQVRFAFPENALIPRNS